MSTFSESRRQGVHVAMSAFALLLPWLSSTQAAGCAFAALAFNAVVLPRLAGGSLFRPQEVARRGAGGIVYYPLSVLALVLAFPSRPDIVGAAWGVLAFGDGFATVVGRRIGGPRWPWNPEKTLAGSAAFVVAGGAAGAFLAWWSRGAAHPVPPMLFTIAAPLIAAVVAAGVESLPIRLDDNLSVPATAAATLWALTLVDAASVARSLPLVSARLPWAVAINVVVGLAGRRAGTVSVSGTVVGILIGVVVYLGTGAAGWALLFACFAVAAMTSRAGLARKARLGIEEGRGGRRGAGNAIANCGLATVAAAWALVAPQEALARLAAVAALVAGSSDTAASEIGKAWGRRTYLISSLARVTPGTSGAMSLEGTAAGIVAATALAGFAAALGLVPPAWIAVVVVAATAGALVESVLGATLESAGVLDNDTLNFVNTAVAALVAVLIVQAAR